MNFDFVQLSPMHVLASLLMVGLAVALGRINRSRLERQYLIGTIRSFVQLWIVGYVLVWIFQTRQPAILILTVEFQILVGTLTAARREESARGLTFVGLWLSIHASVVVVGGYLYAAVVQVDPFAFPQLLIPLMGMVIGNSANGAALCVHRLHGEVESHKGEIEAALALGATPRKALQPYVSATLCNALIPSINSMMLMGIVQLPGMMSGQIIAGIVPEQAVRYQIVVVYLIAGAVALACHCTVRFESKRYFTKHWGLAE